MSFLGVDGFIPSKGRLGLAIQYMSYLVIPSGWICVLFQVLKTAMQDHLNIDGMNSMSFVGDTSFISTKRLDMTDVLTTILDACRTN